MHELSLVHALFDQIERSLQDRQSARLCKVTIRIGAMAGVEAELFDTAFQAAKGLRGHPRAELVTTSEDVAYRCRDCHAEILAGGVLRCVACGGSARLVRGGDVILERMELEVQDV